MSQTDLSKLVEHAKSVLQGNDIGGSTKPAPGLYPHQWNWDSCFIAIGMARYDARRAAEEIRSLLRGQWKNGMVPQIVFNPKASGYFPGPEVWQSDRSPDAPRDVKTSGITDPPMLAIAVRAIWEQAKGETWSSEFLREVYPRVVEFHRFLYEQRNPDANGLIVVVHPWESGLDNSPPYLDAGRRVRLTYKPKYQRLDLQHVAAKHRPSDRDYDLYVWLLEQMRAVRWDQRRYLDTAQLQVQDVLFNAILCRANADLVAMAEALGKDSGQARAWLEQTKTSINERLWDEAEGAYFSLDRVAGRLLRDDTIAGLIALYGGMPPRDRERRLIQEHLHDAAAYWPERGFPVPSTAMNSPWFNPENYWLGPVWVNTNWMLIRGLQTCGEIELSRQLHDRTLELVGRSGFREYYDPRTGAAYGTDRFSWSAALTIDLVLS